MIIREGAILITDVHYHKNFRDKYFLKFVDEVEKKILTQKVQIIFLGDIFDLLFGEIEYTENQNRDIITRLNLIGERAEIIYLEGNHDFNLKSLFPKINIISVEQQPIKFIFNNKNIYLAHGDWNINILFKYYRKLISFPKILRFLNYIDMSINNRIIKYIESKQIKKNKCFKIKDFKNLIYSRLQFFNFKDVIFLEGHFHQGESFDFKNFKYINIKSFACSQSFFIVKSSGNSLYLEEMKLEEL